MVEPDVPSRTARPGAGTADARAMDAILTDATIPEQYEQLIGHLTAAEQELSAGNGAGRSQHLEDASGIVFDLLYALDFRHGGELVPRLAALYGYIGNQLLSVGRTGDPVQLAQIRDMIATLKQAWYDGA